MTVNPFENDAEMLEEVLQAATALSAQDTATPQPRDPQHESWDQAWRAARAAVETASPRAVRAMRRIADAETLLVQGLAPLMLFARLSMGNDRRQTVHGLIAILQADAADPDVVASNGDVTHDSMLYRVLDSLLDLAENRGLPQPHADLQSFIGSDQATALWDALRALTAPPVAPAQGGGSSTVSALAGDVPVVRGGGEPLPQVLGRVDALVGMTAAKAVVHRIAATERMGAARRAHGLPAARRSRHMIFAGNPGTGKTMMARLVADVLSATGAMPGAHLVETDRSGLIGEWLGTPALKTHKMVDAALGGVLFIDEAHALAGTAEQGGDRFAQEALDTLVKAMEDDRDDLVVILAGYTEPMARLVAMNPGLLSRIGHVVEFPDYSDGELLAIATGMLSERGYQLGDGAEVSLAAAVAAAPRGPLFGNARLARTIVEHVIDAHAGRLFPAVSGDGDPVDLEELTTIRLADVIAAMRR